MTHIVSIGIKGLSGSIIAVSIDENPVLSFNRSELIQIAIEIGKVTEICSCIIS